MLIFEIVMVAMAAIVVFNNVVPLTTPIRLPLIGGGLRWMGLAPHTHGPVKLKHIHA